MRLPDITQGGVQDEESPGLEREAGAARQLGSTIEQGLTQFGQEMVKTQTIDAHNDYAKQMDAFTSDLKNRKVFTPDDLRGHLGDEGYNQLPAEARAEAERLVPALDQDGQPVMDQGTGQPKMVPQGAPTFMVADAIFKKKAQSILDSSSERITGSGWQGEFKRAAMADVIAKGNAINDHMIAQAHQFQVDGRSRSAIQAAYRGDYNLAEAIVDGSADVLGKDGQLKLRQQILGLQQVAPFDDVLRAYYTDRDSPEARAGLKQALKDVNDPAKTTMMDPAHRLALARSLERADSEAGKLGHAAQVKASGRKQADDLLVAAGGDYRKALASVKSIGDVEVADETEKRLKDAMNTEHEINQRQDEPLVGRLESRISQGRGLDRNATDYITLSDAGKARVDKAAEAYRRSDRSASAEERREQHDLDLTRESEFDALPLQSADGKDRVSINVDEAFPDASPMMKAKIKARQRVANDQFRKDQGVSASAFDQQINNVARQLRYDPRVSADFLSYMRSKRDDWLVANPTKGQPAGDDVKLLIAKAVTYGDSGSVLSKDRETWRLERAGTMNPPTAKKQPREVRDVTGGAPAPAAASPAPAAPKAPPKQKATVPVGTQLASEALGFAPGGTMEMQANGKWKRVK